MELLQRIYKKNYIISLNSSTVKVDRLDPHSDSLQNGTETQDYTYSHSNIIPDTSQLQYVLVQF